LGKEYGIMKIGYKFYSACRYSSSTLDAVGELVSENDIKPDDVEQVTVRIQKRVSDNFAIYEPEHMIQAQFSIPYVVTMVLLGEPTGPNWFREDLLMNPRVRVLQHKIKLEEDPTATEQFYPNLKTPSTVEILMKDGKKFNKYVEYPKGEPENPFTRQDHINKITNMALWIGMNQAQIDELIQKLDRLETLNDISEFTHFLVP
jgi:2-methylcitrate dehydratase PrpD